ncbi:MAG: hypothetical protein GKR94_31415 [Gammaproteobacteria bacterium]|nr:hypothetical protein [Gammaproteobacteria bacterium]
MNHESEDILRFDLFPDIQPSLLNSVDIAKYAELGCLVSDFDSDRLKPASYEMRFLGELHYWDTEDGERNEKRKIVVSEGEEVELPRNSITYLLLQEEFCLPQYIAARFNLSIGIVHKGLLLGTGPLVDPGFSGRLLIPLHNLTDQNHVLIGGEGLIWVEFTKVSQHAYWREKDEEKPDNLVLFPPRKNSLSAHQYFQKSGVWGGGVVGAFKGELKKAVSAAEGAKKKVKSLRSFGFVAALVLVVAVFTLIVAAVPLVRDALKAYQEAEIMLLEAEESLEKANAILNETRKERRDFHEKLIELMGEPESPLDARNGRPQVRPE